MPKKRTTGAPRRRTPREPKPARPEVRGLTYKVVELSVVDEGTLEHAVNEWVSRGWSLEGVQFAMRESSKRPSMAFVFFTRDGPRSVRAQGEAPEADASPVEQIAAGVLREEMNPVTTSVRDAWARLRELATDGEDEA
jgi:hypothetical protein